MTMLLADAAQSMGDYPTAIGADGIVSRDTQRASPKIVAACASESRSRRNRSITSASRTRRGTSESFQPIQPQRPQRPAQRTHSCSADGGRSLRDCDDLGSGRDSRPYLQPVNNLPAGLLAGSVVSASHVPRQVASAVLIGVDLRPNLSVTGSLATIPWLSALRRENQQVSAWSFLKLGALVMPPALLLAIAGLLITGSVR